MLYKDDFICPVCGKQFSVVWAEKYVYKKSIKGTITYFCGWNCMRKVEKEMEEKPRGRKKCTSTES